MTQSLLILIAFLGGVLIGAVVFLWGMRLGAAVERANMARLSLQKAQEQATQQIEAVKNRATFYDFGMGDK